jgi:hypothetical protein
MAVGLKAIIGGRPLKLALGLAVGVLFLWLAVRQTSLAEVKDVLLAVRPGWIALAFASYAVALLLRVVRWQLIVNFVAPLNFKQVAVALVVGYAVNMVLPARLGELFRADFVKRQYHVQRSVALGTIAIERLMDGVFVLAALAIGVAFAKGPIQTDISLPGLILAGAALFGSVGLALFILGGPHEFRWLAERSPQIHQRLAALQGVARLVRHPRIVTVGLMTVPVWIFDAGAIWGILRACDIALSPIQMCAAIGIISLSTLLPSPPGYLGTMQFAFALVATMFGFKAAQGIAAATANQIFLLGTMTIVGLTQLSRHYVAGLRTDVSGN